MLVGEVTAPREVKDDEPFKVSAQIIANREAPAEISLYRNGVRVATQPTTLHPGTNRFESTQSVSGERVFEFAVEVRAKNPADDTLADNNTASAYVQAAGKSKVLLLADKPEQARYLALALRQEGILLDVRPAAGAPTDLGDLQNYDLLVIDNVPATDLSPDQMRLMAGYVREFGGGLLMLGGDQAFGLGGYYQTPWRKSSPCAAISRSNRKTPSLGLLCIIDRSGSMTGEKIEMAKDAARAAVELLSPRDYAGVVAFDDQAFWVAEMTSAVDKDALLARIATLQPGGGTNIAAGLELGFSQISASPAKIKHVILLTDGVSTPGPFYELTSRMAEDRITVSTVAVGADAGPEALRTDRRVGQRPRLRHRHAGQHPANLRARNHDCLQVSHPGSPLPAGGRTPGGFPERRRFPDGALPPGLRDHPPQTHRRELAGHRTRRAAPFDVALRSRANRRVHQRRPQPLGGRMAQVGRLRQVLGAGRPQAWRAPPR